MSVVTELRRKVLEALPDPIVNTLRVTRGPWMDRREIALIESYLKSDDTMLEWGSGGSTIRYSRFVKRYYSIEHDPAWALTIRRAIAIEKLRRTPQTSGANINYHVVPADAERSIPSKREEFATYIDFVDHLGVDHFDVVLIDGRARDFCAEKILPYIDQDSTVFIHDFFTPGREHYHRVLDWYDIDAKITDTPQTIVVLKKK